MTHPQKKKRTNPVVGSLTVWKCPECHRQAADGPYSVQHVFNCSGDPEAIEVIPRPLHDAEVARLRSAINITIGRLRGAAQGAEWVGITGLKELDEWADFLETESHD